MLGSRPLIPHRNSVRFFISKGPTIWFSGGGGCGVGVGGGVLGFFLEPNFLFSQQKARIFFFHSVKAKIYFSMTQKQVFLKHILEI